MICSTFEALKAGAGESAETSKSKINILKVSNWTNPSPSLLASHQSHFSKTQESALPDYTDCAVVLAGQRWRVLPASLLWSTGSPDVFGLINTTFNSHQKVPLSEKVTRLYSYSLLLTVCPLLLQQLILWFRGCVLCAKELAAEQWAQGLLPYCATSCFIHSRGRPIVDF